MAKHGDDKVDAKAVTSALQRIQEEKRQKEEAEKKIIDNEKEYKAAIDRLFSTEDGMLFMKYFIRYCDVFGVDNSHDPATIMKNATKRNVYLGFIRPFLDESVRNKIENQ